MECEGEATNRDERRGCEAGIGVGREKGQVVKERELRDRNEESAKQRQRQPPRQAEAGEVRLGSGRGRCVRAPGTLFPNSEAVAHYLALKPRERRVLSRCDWSKRGGVATLAAQAPRGFHVGRQKWQERDGASWLLLPLIHSAVTVELSSQAAITNCFQ